jgi:hypothetical protein
MAPITLGPPERDEFAQTYPDAGRARADHTAKVRAYLVAQVTSVLDKIFKELGTENNREILFEKNGGLQVPVIFNQAHRSETVIKEVVKHLESAGYTVDTTHAGDIVNPYLVISTPEKGQTMA